MCKKGSLGRNLLKKKCNLVTIVLWITRLQSNSKVTAKVTSKNPENTLYFIYCNFVTFFLYINIKGVRFKISHCSSLFVVNMDVICKRKIPLSKIYFSCFVLGSIYNYHQIKIVLLLHFRYSNLSIKYKILTTSM